MNNNQLTYLHALGITPWQRNTTFNVKTNAKLMIIRDSTHSDQQRTESLLTNMLQAIGMDLSQVTITVIPPNATALDDAIARNQPSLVLVLGQAVAQSLLNSTKPLSELRQHIHTVGTTRSPMIVTYHPLDLLDTPHDKKQAFADLQLMARLL